MIQEGKKYKYIDKTGSTVINVKGKYPSEFSEGYASLQINEKWGYIDKTGKIAIEPKYDMAYSFTD